LRRSAARSDPRAGAAASHRARAEVGFITVFLASGDPNMVTGETIFIDAGVTAA
jgi:enoyl-[acyl-carrier-protein] reductase (NADH)